MSTNPNDIRSQTELNNCNDGKRSSDVLIATIEELEKTKKQLDRAIWWLNEIVTNHRFTPISTAEKALKEIQEISKW